MKLSKEFIAHKNNIPTAPPFNDVKIPEEYAHLHVPMMPKDFQAPMCKVPEGFLGEEVHIGGTRGLHIVKEDEHPDWCMMHIHGGGFTIGSCMDAPDMLAMFADTLKMNTYSVEYHLAPYYKYPVGVNDIIAFYKGLLAMGYKHIIVGGESAGAGLTLSVTHKLREQGIQQPDCLWCSSPVDDMQYDKKELWLNDLFVASAAGMIEGYVGDADLEDPGHSPIYGDFTNFPPTYIQAGTAESLLPGAMRLVQAMAKAGCEVHFHVGRQMPHTFAIDYAIYPEAAYAMKEITDFILYTMNCVENYVED